MKRTTLRMIQTAVLLFTAAVLSMAADAKGATIYQTSKSGDNLKLKGKVAYSPWNEDKGRIRFKLNPAQTYQSIMGFGCSFTESSAYLYSTLSPEKKKEVADAFFSTNGAGFSMMRTQIGGCDFSLESYSYDTNPGDVNLKSFTIDHDKQWLIPLIKDAMAAPGAEFKILASPWSPPDWMKDNKSYVSGSLLPEYYKAYAGYFVKYLQAYKKEGINIWGVTIQNEPQHGGNWDSCKWSASQELIFVKDNLGPLFEKNKMDTKILCYDHNKDNIYSWANTVLGSKKGSKYYWGTAFHWYDTFYGVADNGTPNYRFENLEMVHNSFPDKHLMHTEACVKPAMTNGAYWELTRDWTGYMYIAAHRYGIDIIGDLNSWTEGWIEWNLLLNMQGRPNHANNYDSAPILMDEETKQLFYNPSFYIMAHFSKFIRPGAIRMDMNISTNENNQVVFATAFKNKDGKIAVAIFNTNDSGYNYQIGIDSNCINYNIDGNSLQTIVLE